MRRVLQRSEWWRVSVGYFVFLAVAQVLADPNPQEQLFIYELNRARNDPLRYQTENSNIVTDSLANVVMQPPLAVNPSLIDSAGFRAFEMAVSNYCAHTSPVTGLQPNKIARDFGYQLPAFYPDAANNIESIFCQYNSGSSFTNNLALYGLAQLIQDNGIPSLGHRIHLLAMSAFFEDHREIGVGIESAFAGGFTQGRVVVHTADVDPSDFFLTGVVYNDANANFRYDLNEGLGSVIISLGSTNIQSLATGGWAIKVPPGSYTVVASGGAYSGTATAQVVVVDANIEIDFRSGGNIGEVDFANQIPHADLLVTKIAAPSPVGAGSNLTYTVIVTNRGPNTATSVILTDFLPINTTFVSASNCGQAGGVVTCNLGTIVKGAKVTRTIVVTPNDAGILTNVATVAANEDDPVPGNNTATAITTVNPPPCNIICPANIAVGTDAGQCGAIVNYPAPNTTGPCGTVICTPLSGSFFPKGTNTVTCSEGSGASCTFKVIVNDTENPMITCPSNITVPAAPELCTSNVTFNVPATDNCPGANVVCNPPSGFAFPKGQTTVNCTATDAAGRTAMCSFTVTVTDTQPPDITCPAPVIAAAAPGQTNAMVNFLAPSVSDNCPGASVACLPVSGSTFSLGTNTVTCIATDLSSNTSTCNFDVIVQPAPPEPHDLAVIKMKAPKKINFAADVPNNVVGTFVVSIQNRSAHSEIISNATVLANLVTVSVQSLSNCPSFSATMVPPTTAFPITLASKKKLNVAFTATFTCANDPLANSKTAPHADYRVIASVHHSAIDGIADTHPEDDNCPHAAPPGGIDPNPDGSIKDKGCGGKTPAGTLGADVLTDVVVK